MDNCNKTKSPNNHGTNCVRTSSYLSQPSECFNPTERCQIVVRQNQRIQCLEGGNDICIAQLVVVGDQGLQLRQLRQTLFGVCGLGRAGKKVKKVMLNHCTLTSGRRSSSLCDTLSTIKRVKRRNPLSAQTSVNLLLASDNHVRCVRNLKPFALQCG